MRLLRQILCAFLLTTSAACATRPSTDTPPGLAAAEQLAACPPFPEGYEAYPAFPVFSKGMTWDAWGDAWMNWGLTTWDLLQRQKKWKAEKWKNCKVF